MNRNDLSAFYNRHCRFRLKSGKEIFGVVWEHEDEQGNLRFASIAEARMIYNSPGRPGLTISPDEIAGAEAVS